MRLETMGALLAVSLVLSACAMSGDSGLPPESEDPLIQVTAEGGFAPVEYVLGRGPQYTLLANGDLIYEGPVIAIYPGPLLPNYQVTTVSSEDLRSVLDLVEEMGLANITDERDDSANRNIADATTSVVDFWDEQGTHRYSVYALSEAPELDDVRNRAFLELVELLGQLTASGPSTSYETDRVQVIAGVGFTDPDFPDHREWPLEGTDFADWLTLPNQWMCKVYGAEALDAFADATQATEWAHPGPMMDAPPFKLVVRPLHPGEPDCFQES